MPGSKSKEELVDEASHVIFELDRLQDTANKFQGLFQQLETQRLEVRRSHFPPKYFLMKDLVREHSRLAADLVSKESAQEQPDANNTGRGGVVTGLLDKCRAFREKGREVNKLESIRAELSKLKKTKLKEKLQQKLSQLDEAKATLKQLRELMYSLGHLYRDSRTALPWVRYKKLLHGVKDIVRSFREISGKTSLQSRSQMAAATE